MRGPVLGLLLSLSGAAAAQGMTPTGFQLPSGRLHCQAQSADPASGQAATVRCDVMGASFRAPPREDCPLDFGDALSLSATGRATWVCHGDTVADPRLPVLAYGQVWNWHGLRCSSAVTGVRCVNRDGHGFELARRQARVF